MTCTDDIFDRPLEYLRSCHAALPPHLTRSRFFGLMVEHGLLSSAVVDDYLQAYQIAEYAPGGEGDPDAGLVVEVLEKELAGIDFDAGNARAFVAALGTPEPVVLCRDAPDDEPLIDEDESWPIAHEDEYDLDDVDVESPTRRKRGFNIKGTALLVLWSIVMLGLGHWGPDFAKRALRMVDYHFFGGARYVGTERQLELVRQRAGANPEKMSYWREYEALARRTGRWDDLVLALRHQVHRRPDNAELLNALAWLLCTVDALHVRDPVEALSLGERAYRLNQAPHITDTLAEAAFQTGDVERAIALEEDALSRIGNENGFYRAQLKKFKAGLH